MAGYFLSDEDWIAEWKKIGSPQKFAEIHKLDIRSIYNRRRSLETRHGIELPSFNDQRVSVEKKIMQTDGHTRRGFDVEKGRVIVFSDAHFWPGIHTTAFKGLLWAIKAFKPHAVINAGDAFDGASISRYPRIGWDSTPSVIQELKACDIALGEIEDTAKKVRSNTQLIWTLGNHDARFENRLAANAPQYEFVKGFSLKDHFPAWHPCWACWPAEGTIVKHRWKGGIHATHNNTVNSGVNIVTGHLHSLKVTPFDDYHGTRYGVDTGTLADPSGPQFENYLELSPTNWRSGFAILTFHDGNLLWPELVHTWADNQIEFRGKIHDV